MESELYDRVVPNYRFCLLRQYVNVFDDRPDVPVVATNSARVLDAAVEEASLRRLSPGDSVQVGGRTEAGYLYAERITLAGARASARTPSEPARSTGSARDAEEARDEEAPRGAGGRGRENRQVPEGHRPPRGVPRLGSQLPPGQQLAAAVALGNWGSPEAVPALALNDEEPLVRGHAAWALGRIGTETARQALQGREEVEEDAWVISEIESSLDEN